MNDTYHVEHLVGGCDIVEMDHFGEPGTGFLWCSTHGVVAGRVVHAGDGER